MLLKRYQERLQKCQVLFSKWICFLPSCPLQIKKASSQKQVKNIIMVALLPLTFLNKENQNLIKGEAIGQLQLLLSTGQGNSTPYYFSLHWLSHPPSCPGFIPLERPLLDCAGFCVAHHLTQEGPVLESRGTTATQVLNINSTSPLQFPQLPTKSCTAIQEPEHFVKLCFWTVQGQQWPGTLKPSFCLVLKI